MILYYQANQAGYSDLQIVYFSGFKHRERFCNNSRGEGENRRRRGEGVQFY